MIQAQIETSEDENGFYATLHIGVHKKCPDGITALRIQELINTHFASKHTISRLLEDGKIVSFTPKQKASKSA